MLPVFVEHGHCADLRVSAEMVSDCVTRSHGKEGFRWSTTRLRKAQLQRPLSEMRRHGSFQACSQLEFSCSSDGF